MLARVDALAESLRSSAEPLVTGHRFKGRWELIACDATPGSALDAVAAIRTIEAEEDGIPPASWCWAVGQCCYRSGTARARRAGLPRQSPARGAPDAAPQAPP